MKINIFIKKSNLEPSIAQPPVNTPSDVHVNASPVDDPIEIGSGYIPEPPPIVDESAVINALGEPTFDSIGLGLSMWPWSWAQLGLEFIHVNLNLAWIPAIVAFTLILRACTFPIVVKTQRNAVYLRRTRPTMTLLNENLTDAKSTGNPLESK